MTMTMTMAMAMTMTMMMMMPTTTTALWLQGIPSMNIVLIKRLNKSIFFMVINICCKGVNKHNADVINIKEQTSANQAAERGLN